MEHALRLPEPLRRALERIARRSHKTVDEVAETALRDFVERESSERDRGSDPAQVTRRLDEVYGPAGESSTLDPEFAALQSRSLRDDW